MERGRWPGGGGWWNRGVESGIGEDRGLRSDRGRGGEQESPSSLRSVPKGAAGRVVMSHLSHSCLGVSVSRGKREEEGRQRGRDMIRR